MKVTPDQKQRAKNSSNGVCGYCGTELIFTRENIPEQATIEHIHPICLGGDSSDENLMYACRKCNTKKQGKSLEEYRIYLAYSEISSVLGFTVPQIVWLLDNTDFKESAYPVTVTFHFEREATA